MMRFSPERWHAHRVMLDAPLSCPQGAFFSPNPFKWWLGLLSADIGKPLATNRDLFIQPRG